MLDVLGLSARAGALVSGTGAVRAAAREAKVHHVVLAADAAEGQRRKLIPLLDARRIPYSIGFTRAELGAATGRPPVSAVGIDNPKLAGRARELLAGLEDRRPQ
ncbi:MAG TPA: ribosomal L7Ae/L30e/S12e/Gadd45 family protein [Longimicrobiaceae bacterium]|nr:ribosomal L7Ae/L30e/S12e/Gadd45 family protein [Longimicrobiaceae bacterium]